MKIKGKITFLVGSEVTRIEIRDSNAAITFAHIKLNPEQLARILSRQAHVDCEIELGGLEYIGKKKETGSIIFEIPEGVNKSDDKKLKEIADSKLSDGWAADSYFRSQNSFSYKEGKHFARAIIRRWV